MPRRNRPERRTIKPDPRYNSATLQQFVNKVMMDGKKGVAERVVYGALDQIQERTRQDPLEVFQQALRNVAPQMEVKPRRVGGATYQVPVEVRSDRAHALATRWLLQAVRSRSGRSLQERLAQELLDASQSTGAAVKRREDTHRMVEANRAFVHYRW